MSYVNEMECTIIPTSTFKINRACSGCGTKQIFASMDNFRVNANGKQLDVWLIYGCEKCGKTYNLSIYERISKDRIKEHQYLNFLSNDQSEVFKWGTNKSVFDRNKAQMEWSQNLYDIEIKHLGKEIKPLGKEITKEQKLVLKISNPYNIPVRNDKIVAEVLRITRKQAKKYLEEEMITIETGGTTI